MVRNLATYLHDHLAGADMAVDLIQSLSENQAKESVRMFLRGLLLEVAEDRDTLRTLASEGGYGSSTVKNSAAHLTAKVVTLKLSAGKDAFGLFEAFEFIALGTLGKLALWKALREVNLEWVPSSINYDHLIGRAERQHSAVEQYRLASVPEALCQ